MTLIFDPDAGVLRLPHGALSVLARLAAEPTHPDLVDHAVAPPLAALRRAGIIGAEGIHPDVRPLAEVIGGPAAVLDLHLTQRAAAWRVRGWVAPQLLVMAVPTQDDPSTYDLVADVPSVGGELIGDLVRLPVLAAAAGAPIRTTARTLEALFAETDATALEPTAGSAVELDVPDGLADLLAGLHAHWRLSVRRSVEVGGSEEVGGPVEVLDAGDAGLWLVETGGGGGMVALVPVTAVAVRERVRGLLEAALR
jgi:hypothetical protein